MTVKLFEAAQPPTVFLLYAAEGGMQRVITGSYDLITGDCHWKTFYMDEKPVLDKIYRVRKVQLGDIRE